MQEVFEKKSKKFFVNTANFAPKAPEKRQKRKIQAGKGFFCEKRLTNSRSYDTIVNCITIACFWKELVKVQYFCFLQGKNFVGLTMPKM